MTFKFKRLYQAFQAYKNSANLGDFALLKADALGAQANPAIVEKMEQVKGYHPAINLAKLAQLPPGTFGYEYAFFMQRNQLQPLNISPELEDVAISNVFALRYAVTHDMFHVLLGFDTSYAGEIGVLAFAVSQKYSRSQIISLWVAQVLYPILAPQQFKSILVNLRRGKQMGRQADFLLNYRFEEYWAEPLAILTQKLGLSSQDL
ncbi:MAG: Coq4 family protein [Cyanobacteria bacterium P01_G01_bin.39]